MDRSKPDNPAGPSNRHRGVPLAVLLLLATIVVGCRSTDQAGTADPSTADPRPVPGAGPATAGGAAAPAIDVEQAYVIGPATARALDYRVDWQVRALPSGETGLRTVSVQGDSVFVLDRQNYLSRYRRDDGERLWRTPVGDTWEEIVGVTYVPEAERIYLTAGGALVVIDAMTGSTVGRQRLAKVANTAPVRFDDYLIYGARNGQLVWHAFPVAFQYRAYQVSSSIKVDPVLHGRTVVCAGVDGRVMAIDAATASQLWNKRLLDAVVARPVVENDTVFLAGTDQYVYAIDLMSGRTMWSRLMTSPLTASPRLIENRLYQQVPGAGLACFDAFAINDPDGDVLWQTPEITGDVVVRRRQKLIVFDARAGRIDVVDRRGGAVIESIDAPQLDRLMSNAAVDGSLFAVAKDGRVERLVPRN